MPQVKWLPDALGDVQRLHAFLKEKDTEAASKAVDRILEGARLLRSSPRIGRPMADGAGKREVFVAFGSGAYVLRYMLEGNDTVVIIRVWHSRESRE